MKRLIITIFFIAFSVVAFGQNERKHVRSGNKLFYEAVQDTTKIDTVKFSNAETEYRKALNKKPNDLKWNFNLADAIYKQKRFDEAAGKFAELGEKMTTPEEKARAYHNMGNSQLMNQKIDESIETYKKALRQNPADLDTKYNLAYAQLLKKKQEQQQQNQDQNQDKNQDKQDQNKDQQNKDKQDQQNQDQQQKQQPQQNKISKENAEQLLQVLQNDEREIQDKVKKAQAVMAKRSRTEKEW
ncbi:MAG TPA: tetratricopeptide repeat protein [Draconibacterium sp.]|nr:tetratricopeptide repeat protein [Draconibacterium sp.]